jgi:hypothetical protein
LRSAEGCKRTLFFGSKGLQKAKITTKATEVVAKKVGVSLGLLREAKILENACEEDKQKLREGKPSIAKVYREVVAPKQEANKT